MAGKKRTNTDTNILFFFLIKVDTCNFISMKNNYIKRFQKKPTTGGKRLKISKIRGSLGVAHGHNRGRERVNYT